MTGLQCHLDSSVVHVRVQGMVVGETLTRIVDPDGQKLKFEVSPSAMLLCNTKIRPVVTMRLLKQMAHHFYRMTDHFY